MQVLLNIVNNAIKFTDSGKIEMNVSLNSKSNDMVELQFDIIDTGIGMTDQEVGKLFQSFVQTDSSITRKYGGTGLGLSISKNLIELMNGKNTNANYLIEGMNVLLVEDDEFEEMKMHSVYGKKVISRVRKNVKDDFFLSYAEEMAYTHHEKWDGSGYPNGFIGEAIPLSGRLMALADVFDALISKRVYKEAFSYEVTREIITSKSGTHFDPKIVQAFLILEEKFIEIAEELKDSI